MKRLFEFLISGCFHKWEIIHVVDTTSAANRYGINTGQPLIPCGTDYVLQCKKCGSLRKKRA
jgi:sugar (pentulose or hexulose) kinase